MRPFGSAGCRPSRMPMLMMCGLYQGRTRHPRATPLAALLKCLTHYELLVSRKPRLRGECEQVKACMECLLSASAACCFPLHV